MKNNYLFKSKNIYAFLILFSLLFFFTQCTSRYSQKDFEQILSTERVTAGTSDISILVPKGWRSVVANDTSFVDLWLVNKDYSNSLSIIPYHTKKNKQSLTEWTSVSKLSNKMKFKNENIEIVDDGEEDINGIQTSSYYFMTNDALYRITIFELNGKFFELTALDKDPNFKRDSHLDNLRQLQIAVIQSAR